MRKIKKLFLTVVLLAMCVCCIIPFTACDTLNSEDDWTEVQSITYTTESGSKTLTSIFNWNITEEDISPEEYESAPEDLQRFPPSSDIPMNKDRDSFIPYLNSQVGQPYYFYFYYSYSSYICEKFTYNSYEIKYVKIKFNKNGSLDINFDGHTTTVLPITYEITCFEN